MLRHPWTCDCPDCQADHALDDRRHNRGGPWTPDQGIGELAQFSGDPGRAVVRETPAIGAVDRPEGPAEPRNRAL